MCKMYKQKIQQEVYWVFSLQELIFNKLETTEISNHIISIWIEKLRSSVMNWSGKPSVYIGLTADIKDLKNLI